MRTPALHRLAREGTCFDLTYAANPVCVPSRYSLLTGHLPHRFDGPGDEPPEASPTSTVCATTRVSRRSCCRCGSVRVPCEARQMDNQAAVPETGPDRRQLLAGACLVAAAGLMFALAGMAIGMAATTLSSVEVLFWRNTLSLVILTPWVVMRWPESSRPAHAGLIVMRGVTVVVSLLFYYYAVTLIPLAEAVLLNFSAPIFVPILGLLLFRFRLRRSSSHPQAWHGLLPTRRLDRARRRCARRTRDRGVMAHAET